ncbi:MAG: hypothetical protein IT405_01670 [Candidatus Yanofskybacteria bacterium]|nr:hypothetical protein [Candidatus Yanofskybacteria bacterium]
MNSTFRTLLSILLLAAGVFLFVYGGYDDSPGAQGLGLLIAAYGVVRFWRSYRASKL